MTEDGSYKYRVFISYAHRDGEWAHWLHRALEHYRAPRTPFRSGRQAHRIGRCFRDEEELRSGELGPQIERALAQSRSLIVVCSPNAAASKWVADEVRQFKGRRGDRDVYALIVDGKPHTGNADECFPEPLKRRVTLEGRVTDEPAEPLAPDVRVLGKDGALLRLVAGLMDLDFEDLAQRELRRRRQQRRRAVVLTVVGASLVAFGVTGIGLAWRLNQDVMLARSRLLAAASTAELSKGHVDNAALLALLAAPPPQAKVQPSLDSQRALDAAGVFAGQTKAVLPDLTSNVTGIRISSDGRYVFTADETGTLLVYALANAELLMRIGGGATNSHRAVFDVSASGGHLAVALRGGGAEVWSTQTRQREAKLDTTAGELRNVSFVSESADGEARLLLVSSEGEIASADLKQGRLTTQVIGRTPHGLTNAWVSEDRTLIAALEQDTLALRLLDADTGRLRHLFGGYRSSISNVLFDPAGGLIYTAAYDKSVRIFDLDQGKMLAGAEGDGPVLWIAQPPDRSELLATFPAGTVNIWRVRRDARGVPSLDLAETAPFHERWLAAAKYAATGDYLATIGRDRMLMVWNRESHLVARYPGHATGVVALDISPDGRTIVTGDEDGVVRVWNAPRSMTAMKRDAPPASYTAEQICRGLPSGRRTLLLPVPGQNRLRRGMYAPEEIAASHIIKASETDPCKRTTEGLLHFLLGD